MPGSYLLQKTLYSPYLIFIRCGGACSHGDLLTRFSLGHYKPTHSPGRARHALLFDLDDWKLIADDWFYTLWHMETTRPAIEQISHDYDVYACSVGDCDLSFDFIYYKDQRLIRHFRADSPNYNNQIVAKDFGAPLDCEAGLEDTGDALDLVRVIAEGIGIRLPDIGDPAWAFAG